MLERLEALQALAENGTMGRAAASLRVTQSAVSKRVAALEAELSIKLVERHGRYLRLTDEARRILADARPLLANLRDVLRPRAALREPVLRVAATDSLLASWLPRVLRAAQELRPTLVIELHAHRGKPLLERVRAGDYALGLCPAAVGDRDLVQRELVREPMVIVPARLSPLSLSGSIPVWAIEQRSLTWEAIAARLSRLPRSAGFRLDVVARLESFAALVQVARAGFAHTLVPRGIARDLGVPADKLVALPGLTRPIAAVARRTTLESRAVRALLSALSELLKQQPL